MKRILSTAFILLISLSAFSQTTSTVATTQSQKDAIFLETLGGVTAGFLYNSYICVGSIADLQFKEVYTNDRANDLFNGQKQLFTNMIAALQKLQTSKVLEDESDRNFVRESLIIVEGLKKQVESYQRHMTSKTEAEMKEYDRLRQNNWSKIAKLLDIKEE